MVLYDEFSTPTAEIMSAIGSSDAVGLTGILDDLAGFYQGVLETQDAIVNRDARVRYLSEYRADVQKSFDKLQAVSARGLVRSEHTYKIMFEIDFERSVWEKEINDQLSFVFGLGDQKEIKEKLVGFLDQNKTEINNKLRSAPSTTIDHYKGGMSSSTSFAGIPGGVMTTTRYKYESAAQDLATLEEISKDDQYPGIGFNRNCVTFGAWVDYCTDKLATPELIGALSRINKQQIKPEGTSEALRVAQMIAAYKETKTKLETGVDFRKSYTDLGQKLHVLGDWRNKAFDRLKDNAAGIEGELRESYDRMLELFLNDNKELVEHEKHSVNLERGFRHVFGDLSKSAKLADNERVRESLEDKYAMVVKILPKVLEAAEGQEDSRKTWHLHDLLSADDNRLITPADYVAAKREQRIQWALQPGRTFGRVDVHLPLKGSRYEQIAGMNLKTEIDGENLRVKFDQWKPEQVAEQQ